MLINLKKQNAINRNRILSRNLEYLKKWSESTREYFGKFIHQFQLETKTLKGS